MPIDAACRVLELISSCSCSAYLLLVRGGRELTDAVVQAASIVLASSTAGKGVILAEEPSTEASNLGGLLAIRSW